MSKKTSRAVTLDVADLVEELAWIGKLKTGDVAAIRHVQLSILVGGVQLRRTDYDQFRESLIPVTGGGQSSVLINPARLASLIKPTDRDATLEITDTGLTITLGGRNGRTIRLTGESGADEFPDWPVFDPDGQPVALGSPQLARALTSVGVDDTLPMLTAVRFEDGMMLSTNRFRLTRVTFAEHGFTAMVPGAVLRAFATGTDVVHLERGGGFVRLCSGGRSIIARELDVDFPKWRQLIPDESVVSAMIQRAELLDAIGGDYVTLTLRANGTMLVCAASDGVQVEQTIDTPLLSDDEALPFTVRFTTENLAACLKSIASGVIRFAANPSPRPVMLTGPDQAGDLHLVMPVRIPG